MNNFDHSYLMDCRHCEAIYFLPEDGEPALEKRDWTRHSEGGWACPVCSTEGNPMGNIDYSIDEYRKAKQAEENLLRLRQLRRAKRIFWYGVVCIITGAVYFFSFVKG